MEVYQSEYDLVGAFYIVMDYYKQGDLFTYLSKHGDLEETQVWHFARQLAIGLKSLHERNVVHCDLKPENLLLTPDGLGLVITDLGLATVLKNGEKAKPQLKGTPFYVSPEMYNFQPYTSKVDMWSVGIILYELVTRRNPFARKQDIGRMKVGIAAYLNQSKNVVVPGVSSELETLIASLLQFDSDDRMDFAEYYSSVMMDH